MSCRKQLTMFMGSFVIGDFVFQGIYDVINSLAEEETYQLVVGNTGEGECVYNCWDVSSLLY